MEIKKVKRLTPTERFLYWVVERNRIRERREAGNPKPWTDDKVLQSYFFTNSHRECDKTTVWFRDNVRDPLRDDPRVMFATVCFRWFNLILTGKELMHWPTERHWPGLLGEWKHKRAVSMLSSRRARGEQIFTGAFIIRSEFGRSKIESICEQITNVWKARNQLLEDVEGSSLEAAWNRMKEMPYLGRFMSYEIITDLRYTYLLENAPDIMTWCNLGPGAKRGINRILGNKIEVNKKGGVKGAPCPSNWQEICLELLDEVNSTLDVPHCEMREVEHSLCEYDKYCRILFNEGKSKRTYDGSGA